MITIELSETAEKLLKRIVESRFGPGTGSFMFLIDSMIKHLIREEAHRRGITDLEAKE